MVICKICNQKYHYINNTHLKKHNLTMKEYINLYGNDIKSSEYKKKAYKNHSTTMSRLRLNGIVKPKPMSLIRRKQTSQRMKLNNPMKNPETAKKVSQKLKGRKSYDRTIEHRLLQSKQKIGKLNPRWVEGIKPNRGWGFYKIWKPYRNKALERDKNRCVDCGMTNKFHLETYGKSLHVHHIIPYRISKDNSIRNLVTLCVNCHMKREQKLINKN